MTEAEGTEGAGTSGVGEEDGSMIMVWQEGTPWALAAPTTASSTVDSRVSEAMGADSSPKRPSRPREDDRAGEARAATSFPLVDEGAISAGGLAPSGAAEAPFNLFTAGDGLTKEYGRQASTVETKQSRNQALTGRRLRTQATSGRT